MAKSLSYQEALTKGLVYPGGEESALKLTGGGKGFADTEAFKKAFDTVYQQQKSELNKLQSEVKRRADSWNEFAQREAKAGNPYISQPERWGSYRRLIALQDQAKEMSNTMKAAMEKYKATSGEAIQAEKRETGAAAAARKRLTRGTAGLLAKAGGAGGMVGTGLPELGTGVSGGLGMESQLGRKITL